MFNREIPQLTRVAAGKRAQSIIRRYGIAVLLVSAAFGLTLVVQRFSPYPFLFLFFGAVMASAWFGDWAAGFFAVLLSTVIVGYFFVPAVLLLVHQCDRGAGV